MPCRPQAAAPLAELKNTGRGSDAVVIGEPHRAFCGNQYGLTFRFPAPRSSFAAGETLVDLLQAGIYKKLTVLHALCTAQPRPLTQQPRDLV